MLILFCVCVTIGYHSIASMAKNKLSITRLQIPLDIAGITMVKEELKGLVGRLNTTSVALPYTREKW